MTNETETTTEEGFKIVRFKVIPTEEGFIFPIIEETKFKDIYGNELIKVICENCKEDKTGLPYYNGKGLLLCLGCAVKRGLIK